MATLLHGAILDGAILDGAILDGADLRGADLRNSLGLTVEQLKNAKLDQRTRLPHAVQHLIPSARHPSCQPPRPCAPSDAPICIRHRE